MSSNTRNVSTLFVSVMALSCAAQAQTVVTTTKPTVVTVASSTPAKAAATTVTSTTTKPITVTTTPAATPVVVTAPVVTTPAKNTNTTTGGAASPVTDVPAATVFGSYKRPFAANSPWNSRPINPVLGTDEIPKSSYYPAVSAGPYSTGIFLATANDGPMTITGLNGAAGVDDPDTAVPRPVTLPHWPATTIPATGSDGHADIYDETTGILHSFWQLKQVGGKWQAKMYAWAPMTGKGWGDPAHFYQGARATAVPAGAGLMRKHEIDDGQPIYNHALSMSLTYNALAKSYVYPATSADWDASVNTGKIPQGSLVMLPASYDTSKIASPALRKVAETLKVYGAYVVDRNTGTPFAIYVENGAGFDLHHGTWDNAVAAELERMRGSLRAVVSASSWVDGEGKVTTLAPTLTDNKLSMRGPWTRTSGTGTASFDSWSQSLVFSVAPTKTVVSNGNSTGMTKVNWATAAAGVSHKFTVTATGGATLRMELYSGGSRIADTGNLGNGASARFAWPTGAWFVLTATSGANVASSVRADLTVAP